MRNDGGQRDAGAVGWVSGTVRPARLTGALFRGGWHERAARAEGLQAGWWREWDLNPRLHCNLLPMLELYERERKIGT